MKPSLGITSDFRTFVVYLLHWEHVKEPAKLLKSNRCSERGFTWIYNQVKLQYLSERLFLLLQEHDCLWSWRAIQGYFHSITLFNYNVSPAVKSIYQLKSAWVSRSPMMRNKQYAIGGCQEKKASPPPKLDRMCHITQLTLLSAGRSEPEMKDSRFKNDIVKIWIVFNVQVSWSAQYFLHMLHFQFQHWHASYLHLAPLLCWNTHCTIQALIAPLHLGISILHFLILKTLQ